MKIVKVLVIILLVGVVLCAVGFFAIGGKDGLKKLAQPDERVEKTIVEENKVTSLTLKLSSDDVRFVKATDNKLKIEYYDYVDTPFIYSCEGGNATLTAPTLSVKNWIKLFKINVNPFPYKMTIYLPDTVTEEINITLSSGEVSIENCGIELNKLHIAISSGDVRVSDVKATTVGLKTSSGSMTFSALTATELSCEASSGSMSFSDTKTASCKLNVSSGNITLKSCELGNFETDMSSGNLDGDGLTVSSLRARLSSGNIKLSVTGEVSAYKVTSDIGSGSLSLKDGTGNTLVRTEDDLTYGNGEKNMDLHTSSGNIEVKFLG